MGTTQDRIKNLEIMDVFSMDPSLHTPMIVQKIAHRTFPAKAGTTLRWGGGIYQDEKGEIRVYATGETIGKELLLRCYDKSQ